MSSVRFALVKLVASTSEGRAHQAWGLEAFSVNSNPLDATIVLNILEGWWRFSDSMKTVPTVVLRD